jgi:hypothetical protein
MKIKTHYLQFKHLLTEIPLPKDRYALDFSYGNDFNNKIEMLEKEISQPLENYKVIPTTDHTFDGRPEFLTLDLRTKVGAILGFLEGEYGLEEEEKSNSFPGVTVINNNTIAITTNNTLDNLIEKAESEKEKENLLELKKELEQPKKNWPRIKEILKWGIDFSKELFFQLLPIIMKKYGLDVKS